MRRAVLSLCLLAAAAAAQEPQLQPYLTETEVYLRPTGSFEYEMAAPAGEVELVLAFRYGLYAIDEEGGQQAAVAALKVEYNDADRATSQWNPMRPADAAGAGWAEDEAEPGVFACEGRTTEVTEATLRVHLPTVERWRVRVTGLVDDTSRERCVPTLLAVAELRAKDAARAEAPLLPVAAVGRELTGDEKAPAAAAGAPLPDPPAACPFCGAALGVFVQIGDDRNFHCRRCSGAVHYHGDGALTCSILEDGVRHTYRLELTGERRPQARPSAADAQAPVLRFVRFPPPSAEPEPAEEEPAPEAEEELPPIATGTTGARAARQPDRRPPARAQHGNPWPPLPQRPQ